MTTTTLVHGPATAPSSPGQRRLARLVRGENADPRWARPALLVLLAATAVLYLWGLSRNGWANEYYSAAAQAAGESWSAWFWGAFDAGNLITVDKTPASLWVTGLSVRLFGLSSWSILVPQALAGVASVGILVATVRRWHGPAAGLLAGAVLATTPVATLMFRFNNPDALLVLLLVGAAWAVVRAVEDGRTRWLVLAGTLVGAGFLTKMLQALLVMPAFALAFLVAAPLPLWTRVRRLLVGGLALLLSAGWWVALVELWPGQRPYVGGSQTDSVLELVLGYNGLGRLTGEQTGSVVPGGQAPGPGMWGATGWGRLFDATNGAQASWLLPAAAVGLAALLWLSRRQGRTDRLRTTAVLWGGWLLVTGAVFSFMQGIFHSYYTVALAPAIAALVGASAVELWRRRDALVPRVWLAVMVAAGAWWAGVLLDRVPEWAPWLRPLVLGLGAVTVGGLLLLPLLRRALPERDVARIGLGAAALAVVALLAGPTGYSLATAAQANTGALPSAGPAGSSVGFGPGGTLPTGQGLPDGAGPGGLPDGGLRGGGLPGGGLPGGGALPDGGGFPGGRALPTPPGGGQPGAGGGGGFGLGGGTTVDAELVELLTEDAEDYRWTAATVGSVSAAPLQLASQEPVMALGGFNGTDPAPTLEKFQAHVAAGDVHWFVTGSGAAFGGSSTTAEITAWVEANFEPHTVGGATVYDLTAASGSELST